MRRNFVHNKKSRERNSQSETTWRSKRVDQLTKDERKALKKIRDALNIGRPVKLTLADIVEMQCQDKQTS
jgi:hypothetical protein